MARSKNQIARSKYGMSFEDLSAGQKAHITRAYNEQNTGNSGRSRNTRNTRSNNITVSFKRPGLRNVKTVEVEKGCVVGYALEEAGIHLVTDKEGILNEEGNTVLLTNEAIDGENYVIVPGVSSSE